MSVITEFAMFPTGKGGSVSPYVSRIIKMLRESGLTYQLTAMGTLFETDTFEQALAVIQQAYTQLEPDCDRVYSTVKFDIRKGRENGMQGKITSIENKIGISNK
jgi:uncharacterized protein (TIGR00106 family)